MRSHLLTAARIALALAGLTALLGACGGGEEERGVLAVAFRLDEGTPVMAAYLGDPAEDPFVLPEGRYYVEALDEDGVVVSLGAMDVEEGETVDLPESFAETGGTADTEQAESLKEAAGFAFDVQLLEYTFLDYATAGFSEPPFTSDSPPTAAQLEKMLEIYREIVGQEDALMAALQQIEGRVGVRVDVPYVGLSPASRKEDFREVRDRVLAFVNVLRQREEEAGLEPRFGIPGNDDFTEADFELFMSTIDFEAGVQRKRPEFVRQSPELRAKQQEWERYAAELFQDPYFTDDPNWGYESSEAFSALQTRIEEDIDRWKRRHHPDWDQKWFKDEAEAW